MKLFSPSGPGLSVVAKPRLGDTDQRACKLLPRTIKPRTVPTAPFPSTSSGIEVSRKFAESRRTSLFPRRAKQGGEKGRFGQGKEGGSRWKTGSGEG